MRQTVRKVKNGQEITFVCSKCGNFIHDVFLPTGKKYEGNDWDDIPEKCSCGARIINRQPIIDENGSYTEDTCEDVCEDLYENVNNSVYVNIENVHKNVKENLDISIIRTRDLENAISLNFFDMRLNSFKRNNFKLPANIDFLRLECIKRNISHIESNIEQLSYKDDRYDRYGKYGKDGSDDIDDKREMHEQLNVLRKKYDDLLEKFEDRKDVDKKLKR